MVRTRGWEPCRWELKHTEQGPPLGLYCNSVSRRVDIAICFTANTIHSSMYPSIHPFTHSFLSLRWLKWWSLDSRSFLDLVTGNSHKARLTQSKYELVFYYSSANTIPQQGLLKCNTLLSFLYILFSFSWKFACCSVFHTFIQPKWLSICLIISLSYWIFYINFFIEVSLWESDFQ